MKKKTDMISSYLDLRKYAEDCLDVLYTITKGWSELFQNSLMNILSALSKSEEGDDEVLAKKAFLDSIKEIEKLNEKNAETMGTFCHRAVGDAYSIGYTEGANSAVQGLINHFRALTGEGKMLPDENGTFRQMLNIIEKENEKYFREAMHDKAMSVYFKKDKEKKNEEEE